MSEKVRALSRRDFIEAVAFILGGAAIGGYLSHNPTPEPTPTKGPLPPESTPTPIPGFAEYQALWQGRKDLELLGPGEKIIFPTGQMKLEIEYQGENKIFLDPSLIRTVLDVLFPRPPSPSKSTTSEQLAEKVNWAAQNVWRVTFVDHQEQLPKFGQTGLKEKAKRALSAEGLPEEVEEVTPLTCTYRERGSEWRTVIQTEPTGKLSLVVKSGSVEGAELPIPEKKNEWLARGVRASRLFIYTLLKARGVGLESLPRFPILEITYPNQPDPPETKHCKSLMWSYTVMRSYTGDDTICSPDLIMRASGLSTIEAAIPLLIMPVPKEVMPPSFLRFI